MQAEGEQAVAVATNTPRRVGRRGEGGDVGCEQQKHRVRHAFEMLNQQVLDVMSDLAHASWLH